MTAVGPSGLRPDSGFEEPASKSGRRTWAQRWHRVRLIPLIILLIAAIIATIVGYQTRHASAMEEFIPPEEAPESETARLPAAACQPGLVDPVTGSPWTGDERAASEEIWSEHIGTDPDAQLFVPGEDGWVFWGDTQANNFSQALGRGFLSDDESEEWAEYFRTIDEGLSAQGIDFVIQVVPADWSIYPQQLPEWAQELRGPTALDYLINAHPDLPIVDARQDLRAASADGAVYAPGNSHWSPYGAAIGWQRLAACLGAVDEKYQALAPLEYSSIGDMPVISEFEAYGFPTTETGWGTPVLDQAPPKMQATLNDGSVLDADASKGLDMLQLPATTTTQGAQSELRALIVRDSQGNSAGPTWQTGFAETKQVTSNLGSATEQIPDVLAEAAAYQPDLVIFEMTERYLNWIPALPAK
ncbi:alginate O-acetyltransferase AlgX-related protein [Pseudoclavibacter helvolus]|uniref:alginate O-acetyltransferase AlgX-related protein n=1 Tax=Pseudoclavibacter helvolus TaxID=255205 RepID=UPI003C72C2CC